MKPTRELVIRAPSTHSADAILNPEARAFVAGLAEEFAPRIAARLEDRRERQARYDAGELPDFDPASEDVRTRDWVIAPPPSALARRVVELTGPPERRMVLHGMNSGADVFMADFEDALSPTWSNLIEGQANVLAAATRTLTAPNPDGTTLRLGEHTATLMVRPRGLHLVESHAAFDGEPVPATLFDFGLAAFHLAPVLAARGEHLCFYVPKLESAREAALVRELFRFTERALGLTRGTLKATVLIETLPAAFAMHEILHELREHALGLNCGRWDYIFSGIKTLRHAKGRLLPDRDRLTMDQPSLQAYADLLIQTCHRRGALALGGMAANIPVRGEPRASDEAFDAVRADKEREARAGHDGTWVAHPGLVPVARSAFEAVLSQAPNQLGVTRSDVHVTQADLLAVPQGAVTLDGVRRDLAVALEYLASWLAGTGCVPIGGRMEDAATSEICRALVWQRVRHHAVTDEGTPVDAARVRALIDHEADALRRTLGRRWGDEQLRTARELLTRLTTDATHFDDFLTTAAYPRLVAHDGSPRFER